MPRLRAQVVVPALLLLGMATAGAGTCRGQEGIRRVLVSPEQIPRILQKQPELLTLPLDAFDKTWSAAVRQGQAAGASPGILRATWKARLDGNRLFGEGEMLWPGVSRPTGLRLDAWGL